MYIRACALGLIIVGSRAFAQSSQPILRVNTESHSAAINAIDSDGEIVVSASSDKTARIWDRSSGKLLRVLRPPIGSGNEGLLYAASISPDGKTIACAGWTGPEWDKSGSIYLFERDSGTLSRRITGLPNAVLALDHSADGKYLAATLGGGGLRVFAISTLAKAAEDTDYQGASNSVHFDAKNRIVTTSLDGFIRLYDSSFKRIKTTRAPGGDYVNCARFSPDSSLIAVGYGMHLGVDVFSGADLTLAFTADTKLANKGSWGNVAWSMDGKTLYGGGNVRRGSITVRAWGDRGKGEARDFSAASDTISGLLCARNGGIFYSTFGGELGELSSSGERILYKQPSIMDNRLSQRTLGVSADGASVRFLYPPQRRTVVFNVPSRAMTPSGSSRLPIRSPALYKGNFEVEGAEGGPNPSVNGRRVRLDPGDTCYSACVTASADKALLGTGWTLRLYDADAKLLWRAEAPGVAWSVNTSEDGKIAVAAFGDGSVRWYGMSDGKERLAFLPHADGKRWVIWTPAGYYDCSPGGEDLIGWHVNKGSAREADFFSASRFRKRFYRPEQIAAAIGLKDEAAAQAAQVGPESAAPVETILPPVLRIVSPSDGGSVSASNVVVRYSVRSAEPITRVRAMVDGRPAADTRNLSITASTVDGTVKEIAVPIPERDCEVSLVAENRHSASEPSSVRVKWGGAARPDPFSVKPKLYILAIGVSKYRNPDFRLEFAAKDAADFASAMTSQQGKLYREVVSRVLVDDKASRDDILDGLEWIQKQTTSRDVAMVFLSGHGILDTTRAYYYAPVGIEVDKLKRTGLPFTDIKATVEALAGKALFFVDTCHAGNAIGTTKGAVSTDSIVNELSSAENGAVVFCSSTGRQLSLEKSEWGNGAFTKALIEGLTGKADLQKTGRITVNMLDFYISERVKELTGGSQTPATAKPATVPDFPIAAL